ncbi:MAG: hypothetical protein IJU76_16035 [Desulfovibrionaceae bacterium]|nr:hypothetical protein [Desulfovibrionaceae bacterium]
MNEKSDTTIGDVLRDIQGGDVRRQIRYDEETGDFVIENADTPLNDGVQDATSFAQEGFA